MFPVQDLTLDTPDAPVILGNFIARSIADDCIPPKFLKSYKVSIGAIALLIKYVKFIATLNKTCKILTFIK